MKKLQSTRALKLVGQFIHKEQTATPLFHTNTTTQHHGSKKKNTTKDKQRKCQQQHDRRTEASMKLEEYTLASHETRNEMLQNIEKKQKEEITELVVKRSNEVPCEKKSTEPITIVTIKTDRNGNDVS